MKQTRKRYQNLFEEEKKQETKRGPAKDIKRHQYGRDCNKKFSQDEKQRIAKSRKHYYITHKK